MPIYEYVCQSCGHRAEVIQKVDDPAPAACPACSKGPMSRQVSRTSFLLKGGGWYADLYGSKPAKAPDADAGSTPGGEAAPAVAATPKEGGAQDGGTKQAGAKEAGGASQAQQAGAASAPKGGDGSGSGA